MGKQPRQWSGGSRKQPTVLQSQASGVIDRLARLAHQLLAVILSALLLLQPAIANAQSVSASTTAPVANQPGVGAAPNGVPLIDIVTPNAAGLSHNKFSDFNVGTPGLILNNYKGEVGTSNLGGVTPGNPNLNNSNPASVILNEVTSGNRSALNGPTEVFGTKADVVIANPNGITCSGCGFINTPHATLTTGTPDIGADGSLTGFTVNGGDVTFEGAGGNFASGPGAVDLFDVVSRNIHVNAPVYGKTLRLTGGASKYDYATGEATALTATSGTPEYAIDGSALGAMQADRIKIVVTEKGAGVNMAGDMAANAGELSLSADGKISIGNVSGSQGVSISSKSKVTAAKVTSKQKVTVQTDQGIMLQSVAADDDILLSSGSGLLSVAGDVNSATTVQLSSAAGIAAGSMTAGSGAATLSSSSGDIRITGAANSHGALTITATSGAISAASLLSYNNIGLTAGLDIAVSGNVFAEGNLTASGRSISTGMVVSGLDIAATQADPNGNVVLGAIGDLSLTATNGNIATSNLLSAGLLNAAATGNMAAGSIQSNRDLTVNATSLTASNITSYGALTVNAATDVSGQVLASGDITVTGQGVQAATFASGVDFAATSGAGGTIVLSPTGVLTLDAGAGNIVAGTLLSAGDLNAQAAVVQADSITGHGTIGIDGGVRVSNQLLGAGGITINGNSNGVSAGVLASGVDFAATNAGGGNIVLAQSGDLTINDSAGAIQAGTMLSAGTINAAGRTITSDAITGHGDITLSGATSVSGQILGADNVSVTGPSIAAAAIVSGVDFGATAAAGSAIVQTTSGDLALNASGNIAVGTLLSAGALDVQAANLQADSITSHGDADLQTSLDVSGAVLSAGNLTVNGGSVDAALLVSGVDFAATNAAGGNIVLAPSGDMSLTATSGITAQTMLSAGTLAATASDINAASVTGHGDITLAAGNGVAVTNQILGANDVSLSGQTVNAHQVIAGVDSAATSQSANGAIALGPSGDLTINATSAVTDTLIVAGDLNIDASAFTGGNITGYGAVSIGSATQPGTVGTTTANGRVEINGQLLGAGDVAITGSSISGNVIVAGVDFASTNQSATGDLVLGQSGDLTLNATATDIDVASLLAAGNIDTTAANNISANAVAHGDLTMTAGNAITLSGQSLASGNVTLRARSITADTLVSGLDFAATSASPTASLMLQPAGAMTLAASNGSINANVLLSGGDLAATATQNIGYASLQSIHNATLTAPGRIDYTSTTRVGGALTINTGALDLSGTRGNGIAAGGALVVNASSANLSGSDLVLGGLTLNLSGNADFTNASVNAVTNAGGSGDIAVSAASLTASDSTALLAAHDLSLTLPSLTNAAQLASGHDLTLNIAGNFTNTPTGLVFAGNNANVFLGGVLTNNQGAILAGRDLTIRGAAGAGQHNAGVFNSAGLIQSGGNMSIYTDTLINASTSAPQIVRNVAVSDTLLHAYDLISETYGCETRCSSGEGDHEATYGWTESVDQLVHQIVLQDQLAAGAGADAKIRSGGNLTVDAVNITNSYSSIASDGNMSLAFNGTLTNEGATLNQTTETVCDSATNCQYYADVVSTEPGVQNCSGPNRGCIDGDPTITYSPNPNGQRDPSQDLQSGTSVTVAAIGVLSGAIQARGALSLDGKGTGTVNNAASAGSLAGQVAINAVTAQSNPLSALNGLTAGGALFSVNGSLAGVAANASATAGSGPAIGGNTLLGRLGVAIGNSGNLAEILQTSGAQLAALAKPQSGGVGGTVPGQVFLFETRAAYLDVSKFYGSAYFIDRIGYTPETSVPFLGDAYFENQLVDEQLHQQVGQGLGAGSFVSGDNAIDQMKTLLDNGVGYAEAHGLALGQALTPEQVANLTQSMVIYQTTTVDGVQVLVPVVYLSAADRANVASSAATISGQTVSVNVGNLDNSGAIAAAGDMTISATNIKANGGAFLSGGNMNLDASNGIVLAAQTMNIGGQTLVNTNGGVKASGTLNLDAGAGALTLAATKVTAGSGATLSGQTVTLGAATESNGGKQSIVGTTVAAGGGLSISGADGVNIIASAASSGGNMSVTSTNGAINIVSAAVDNTTVNADRKGTTTTTTSLTEQGSSLTAGDSMLVFGDQGVLIAGSSLDANGNIGIISQNGNVAITAAANETSSSSKTTASAANGYKSGNSTSASLTNTGSSITSGNGGVTVEADNGSIGVIGSSIDANGGSASLIAKNDITIGEATDSASASSQSGSKKTSETVTIAKGSEISGQTGVNVISTQGDVTISASQIAAGDGTHTANANIQAAGNIIVASGKDTDETTSDSKQSGFLSSSKTHTHSYDEATVGSSISASGDINSNAGGENVISGSNMAAGGNLTLSGSTVAIMGAEETHESDSTKKKSGIGVGSGGGFISIYGSSDKTKSNSETDNVGSSLSSGGTTSITSTEGDVNLFGSSVHSGANTVITSARDVNMAPGAEEQHSASDTKRSGIGIKFSSGDGSVSVGLGYGSSEDKRSQDAHTNAVASIVADGGITIAAGHDINDQSGQIKAAGPVDLVAGHSVNLLSNNDVTNASEMQKEFFAGVSVTASSALIGEGQAAAQGLKTLASDNSAYGIAPTVLAGVNAYNTIQNITAPANPITQKKNVAASISITAGVSFSQSSQESTTSIPVPPVVRGSSVTIVAESGDITGRGVQISAGYGKDGQTSTATDDPNNGNILISAAGNVDLESVPATTVNSSSSSAGSVAIGYSWGFDVDKNQVSAGFTASASGSEGKSQGSSVTQVNSNVFASNTVTVVAGDKLTLAGAVLSGNTVNAAAANGIVIESRQDTATYDEKTQSASLAISSGGVSGGYQKGTIAGDYASVTQQSGIVAGSGGYHVTTDGTVDLIGGIIASTADPANNDLTANQILYSNIENSMSASSTSYGVSLIGPGIPVPVVGQPAKQDDHGQTLATITPGNWSLANQSQDLSGLNTDASKANNTVNPFDISKLEAAQQSAAALSELMNMAIGYIGQKYGLADGGADKIALHAAAGALTALVSGGNAGTGALSGAAQELIGAVVDKALADNPDLTQDERNALGQWASVLVGMAAGSAQGAATALDAEQYNRQLHIAEATLIKDNAARFAFEQGLCGNASSPSGCTQATVDVAIGLLTTQALRQTDATAADGSQDSAAAEFLDRIAPRETACTPGGANCYYFHAYGDEYRNATINSQYFAQVLNLYNLASQVYATEHTTFRDFAGALSGAAQLTFAIRSSLAAVDNNNAAWEEFNNLLAIGTGILALSNRTASDSATSIPSTLFSGRIPIDSWFSPPALSVDRQGFLTNGTYRLDAAANGVHETGSASSGKSQFLFRADSASLTLDAAAYADAAGLWDKQGQKAKITLPYPIGVTGSGLPTNVINVYRTESGMVHASPGN